MKEIEHISSQEYDTEAYNFPIVWQFKQGHLKSTFTLVEVPVEEKIEVVYKKLKEGVYMKLAPTVNPQSWTAEGNIDANTIYNLDLSVAKPRRGRWSAEINNEDIENISDYGHIEKNSERENLYNIALWLPTENIAYFFEEVWRPHTNHPSLEVPEIDLGIDKNVRILPKKYVKGRKGEARINIRRIE